MWPVLIPVLVAVAFVLWWTFLLNLIALMSGWWALARHYPARERFDGTRFRMCSARLGWSNYGGCLTVGVNADGLYLAVMFPFRPGHPPLFIPWSEIEADFKEGWLAGHFDVRFRQVPRVCFRFGKALGQKIAAAANRSWSAEPPAERAPEEHGSG